MPKRLKHAVGKGLSLGRRVKKRKVGMPPGYLEYTGDQGDVAFKVEVFNYDAERFDSGFSETVEHCLELESGENPTWVRVVGLGDVKKLSKLMNAHKIHPLLQEDILNTTHRPKVEVGDDHVLVIQKLIVPGSDGEEDRAENISLLLLDGVLITFQETDHKIFAPVVKRLESGKGRIRKLGCDYLLWALLDTVTDHYFVVLDRVENELYELDEQLQDDFSDVDPHRLYRMKHEVTQLSRMLRPVREVVARLEKSESALITVDVLPFLRDLYDHAIHVMEMTDNLRELVGSLRDFYMGAASNRMNEIMKVLTCFSTIFLPLTFLAGIYGMNFQHMPELAWEWGYPVLWGLFGVTALGMFVLFRKMKWI